MVRDGRGYERARLGLCGPGFRTRSVRAARGRWRRLRPDGPGGTRRRGIRPLGALAVRQRLPARHDAHGRRADRGRRRARGQGDGVLRVRRRDPRHVGDDRTAGHRKPRHRGDRHHACRPGMPRRLRATAPATRARSTPFPPSACSRWGSPESRWASRLERSTTSWTSHLRRSRAARSGRSPSAREPRRASPERWPWSDRHARGSTRRLARLGIPRRKAARSRSWRAGSSGSPPPTQRAASAEAVDLMYEAGGGTAIYERSPLERRFRDIHTAKAHMMVSPASLELAGRIRLGLETDTAQL